MGFELGCCDEADRAITAALRQSIWSDDRNPELRISDGSICDDCWGEMGADEEAFEVAVYAPTSQLMPLT